MRWLVRLALSALVGYGVYMLVSYLDASAFDMAQWNFDAIEMRSVPTTAWSFEVRAGLGLGVGALIASWTGLWETFFGEWF